MTRLWSLRPSGVLLAILIVVDDYAQFVCRPDEQMTFARVFDEAVRAERHSCRLSQGSGSPFAPALVSLVETMLASRTLSSSLSAFRYLAHLSGECRG
jgi:hypothetical protein